MWRSESSERVEEMRCGKIVAKRWGCEATDGHQGLSIGFYGEDGRFVTVACVEEDRACDGPRSGIKVHVWDDDADDEPCETVDWMGPVPGNEA